ncbi:MAG: hypothetical protein HDS58_04660 [Barnesiella sp.]|nr:hypothetical protein [Bacteroidales bacterium]MBD5245557.1 hypothetical protein [Barnesiella sp.]MBD5249372.1 hypothetical protein [Barnesiella sp.]
MRTLGNYLTALIIGGAGVLLCMMNSRVQVADTIIMILGALFILCGVITIFSVSQGSRRQQQGIVMRTVAWITSIGGIGLAVAMLVSPEWFMGVLVYMFSAILILCGLIQVIALTWGYRGVRFPGWMYIIPVILLVGGVTMLFSDSLRYDTSRMLLIAGVGLILFGVNYLLQLIIAATRRPKIASTESKEVTEHNDSSEA